MEDTEAPPHAESPTPFRFLDLPPELRNRIYELALPSEWRTSQRTGDQLPLVLRVSRQLRAEAISIWLADTTFISDDSFRLNWFLDAIGPECARRINALRGVIPSLTFMRAMRCARDCEDGFVSLGLRKDAFQFFHGKEGPFRVTWPTTLEEFQEENRQLGEWYNLTGKLMETMTE